jgi:hypothetical protein
MKEMKELKSEEDDESVEILNKKYVKDCFIYSAVVHWLRKIRK